MNVVDYSTGEKAILSKNVSKRTSLISGESFSFMKYQRQSSVPHIPPSSHPSWRVYFIEKPGQEDVETTWYWIKKTYLCYNKAIANNLRTVTDSERMRWNVLCFNDARFSAFRFTFLFLLSKRFPDTSVNENLSLEIYLIWSNFKWMHLIISPSVFLWSDFEELKNRLIAKFCLSKIYDRSF